MPTLDPIRDFLGSRVLRPPVGTTGLSDERQVQRERTSDDSINSQASNAVEANSLVTWGRLRHLFVETLSQSGNARHRIAMIDPTAPNSLLSPWEEQVFPSNLTPWVERYQGVGERGAYLWRWCLYAVDIVTLSTVEPSLWGTVRDIKFLIGMFNCLIDDVVDEARNHRFFRSLMRLIQGGEPHGETPEEVKLAGFAKELWEEIWKRSNELPRSEEFEALLRFDLHQLCNTIEHSDLTLQMPELLNPVEHDMYTPHGMMVTVAGTVDLMGSRTFDKSDLSVLRTVLWHAESMARIGNILSTWEREIPAGDFTSGVFMEAMWRGVIRSDELRSDNESWLIEKIIGSQIESDFLKRWDSHRECVLELGQALKSVDIHDYVDRLDLLIESEIFSHGRK